MTLFLAADDAPFVFGAYSAHLQTAEPEDPEPVATVDDLPVTQREDDLPAA